MNITSVTQTDEKRCILRVHQHGSVDVVTAEHVPMRHLGEIRIGETSESTVLRIISRRERRTPTLEHQHQHGADASLVFPLFVAQTSQKSCGVRRRFVVSTTKTFSVRGCVSAKRENFTYSLFHVSIVPVKLQEYHSYRSLILQENHPKINTH